jgi:elongation factor G
VVGGKRTEGIYPCGDKGFKSMMFSVSLAGYPVLDVKVTLITALPRSRPRQLWLKLLPRVLVVTAEGRSSAARADYEGRRLHARRSIGDVIGDPSDVGMIKSQEPGTTGVRIKS